MNQYRHVITSKSPPWIQISLVLPCFCLRIPCRKPHRVYSPCTPPCAATVSLTFLFLMTLAVLRRTGQVFGRLFPSWDLSGDFPHDGTGVMGSGGEDGRGEMPFSLHCLGGMCYQHDRWLVPLTLITWLRSCLSGLSTGNLHSAPVHTVLFGRKSLHTPHLRSGEQCSTLESENLQNLGFSCLFSPICLFPRSLIYSSVHSWGSRSCARF